MSGRKSVRHASSVASLLFLAVVSSTLMHRTAAAETTVVVAADGTGQFTRVQDAIMSVPNGTAENPVFIRIKPGTYKELIYVQREKRFFHPPKCAKLQAMSQQKVMIAAVQSRCSIDREANLAVAERGIVDAGEDVVG